MDQKEDCKKPEEIEEIESVECRVSGEMIPIEEAYQDSEGNYYRSQRDFYDNYFNCDRCESVESRDIGGSCGDDRLCDGCYCDYTGHCESCEETFYTDDLRYCEDTEQSFCSYCYSQKTNTLLHNYNFKPKPQFIGNSSKVMPYIGFELEIEAKSASLPSLVEEAASIPYVYLKRDGSLNNGFEIVSHPMTLIEHYNNFEEYSSRFNILAKKGSRSHDTDTCGLHFHLERKYLKPLEIEKILFFLSAHQSKIERLARRSSDRWAKVIKKEGVRCKKHKEKSRYQALNLLNRDTIEFRVFKGTLKAETFMASMELCQAIYLFCIEKQVGEKTIKQWDRFLLFLNTKNFKFLPEYLKNHGLAKLDLSPGTIDPLPAEDGSAMQAIGF